MVPNAPDAEPCQAQRQDSRLPIACLSRDHWALAEGQMATVVVVTEATVELVTEATVEVATEPAAHHRTPRGTEHLLGSGLPPVLASSHPPPVVKFVFACLCKIRIAVLFIFLYKISPHVDVDVDIETQPFVKRRILQCQIRQATKPSSKELVVHFLPLAMRHVWATCCKEIIGTEQTS